MDAIVPLDDEERQAGYAGMVGLIVGLVLGAAVLDAVSGPPHLPAQLPSWNTISMTLTGSYLPLDVLAYILTTAAWAVWFWIVTSLLLRLLVATAEVASHGAAWARALASISDRLTLPIVRRAVDGALIATFVVNMVSRTIPGAAAASPPPVSTPHVASIRSHPRPTTPASDHHDGEQPRSVEYTVQPGDTLWGIAEQFYGTGYEFPRLVEANAGRLMPDGQRFTRAGVIQPGWVLHIPLPSDRVHEADGHSYYVVEEGDTLRGIAARLLGNEDRWTDLFDLNRGRARIDGRVLADPDLIWPGLRLQLPLPPARVAAAPGRPHASGPERPRRPPAHPRPRTPIGPEPKPTLATPALVPTPAARTPAPVPAPTVSSRPGPGLPDGDLWLPYGAAGVAAAAAGAGALFLRRRVRRSLNEPPIPLPKVGPPPGDDFVESEPNRMLAHRLHSGEGEPVALVAEHACRFLAEHGVGQISVIWGEQGNNVVTLLFSAGPQDQERILELAGEFGALLSGKGRALVTPDRDIALHVAGLRGAALIAPPSQPPALQLFPLGVLPGGEVLHANWQALGHILVAGMPFEGTDVVLTSLLASLAARCSPATLRLWTIADQRKLSAQLRNLPHQCCGFVDPTNEAEVAEVLERLRTELGRRMRGGEGEQRGRGRPSPEAPEIVLVVGELADLGDDGTTLAMIATHGPDHGMRLVAATARAHALADDILSYFETRLVLQAFDDDQSTRVLGRPEAADLGTGEFFLRVGGRRPIRIRGFRVSSDHLDELLRLMGEAYSERVALWPGGAKRETAEKISPLTGQDGMAGVGGHDRAGGAPDSASGQESTGRTGSGAEDVTPREAVSAGDIAVEDMTTGDVIHGQGPAADNGIAASQAIESYDVTLEETEPPNGQPANLEMPGLSIEEDVDPGGNGLDARAEAQPLIEIRCFGDFVVTSAGREITPSGEEGPSYKAWEVLAYLAAQPEAIVSRDKLLADVWVDVETERARMRMRTALKRLRDVLGAQIPDLPTDVVRTYRHGICRLDPKLVTSDVRQFVSLLRTAEKLPPVEAKRVLEQALALYRGDLLSGRGAHLYEWVEGRDESGVSLREQYREEYRRATQRLAGLYCEEGHPELAVPLYKEILKAEPTLEDVVRKLYRCYAELGDLTALIREDQHLRQALREAYADLRGQKPNAADLQPEPETVALFQELREELEEQAAGSGAVRPLDHGRGEGRARPS